MRRFANVAILTLLVLSGCASAELETPPDISRRTLLISTDVVGFEYPYRVCVRKVLGFCRRWEMRKEYYDLMDPKVRDELKHRGFVLVVAPKQLP